MKQTLLDGREFWTTHNGFKYWVKTKKGVVTEVISTYYATLITRLRLERSKKFKRKQLWNTDTKKNGGGDMSHKTE